MKVLVTGCAGYIGNRLLEPLAAAGHTVVGIDRQRCDHPALSRFVHGDLLAPGVAEQGVRGADVVLHLAAAKADWGIPVAEFNRDNVDATRSLLSAGVSAGVRRWLFLSSVAAMGPGEEARDETAELAPAIPYGTSKRDAELLFHELADGEPDVAVTIVRPSVVFGPGNPWNTNVYRLIDAIHRRRFVMVGDGSTIKTTSYIDNLVAATTFLLDRLSAGVATYIYVDEPALTTRQMVDLICRVLGRKPPRWHVPLGPVRHAARVGDVLAATLRRDLPITGARIEKFNQATAFDASAIRRLGFEQPVAIDDAIQATVRWHLDGTSPPR